MSIAAKPWPRNVAEPGCPGTTTTHPNDVGRCATGCCSRDIDSHANAVCGKCLCQHERRARGGRYKKHSAGFRPELPGPFAVGSKAPISAASTRTPAVSHHFHPSGRPARAINICRQILPQADAGTRTPDPFITSEVLYQLSYVGDAASLTRLRRFPDPARPPRDARGITNRSVSPGSRPWPASLRPGRPNARGRATARRS